MGNLFAVLFWVWMVMSWFTHIFTCFAEQAWGFLIAGAIMFPIAIFHGTWLWFT